ncbi:hypothetical protein JCM10207_007246 [Rhodosporidiobolus poonsookiae]
MSTLAVGVGKSEVTGQPGIGFDPSYTVVVPHGDGNQVVFRQLEGAHRVVSVDFEAPCTPNGDFDSGLINVPAGTSEDSAPTATFDITNDTAVYYFADIGSDNSPCYLGAVFCLNTDESSDTACYRAKAAATALGTQYGVSTTPAISSASSTSGASSASSAAASASTTSAPASSSTGTGTNRAASATSSTPSASATDGGNGAGRMSAVGGAAGVLAGVAAAALL